MMTTNFYALAHPDAIADNAAVYFPLAKQKHISKIVTTRLCDKPAAADDNYLIRFIHWHMMMVLMLMYICTSIQNTHIPTK